MGKFGGRTGTVLLATPKPQVVTVDRIFDDQGFWFGCGGTDDFRLIVEPYANGDITIIPFSRDAVDALVERIRIVLAMQGEASDK